MNATPDASKPGDARFFRRTGPHSLSVIAEAANAEPGRLGAARDRLITGVAPLQSAGPEDVSFLDNRRYADLLAVTKAGAVIVHPDFETRVPATAIAIVTPEPYVGWAKVSALFHPPAAAAAGVHPNAIIGAGADDRSGRRNRPRRRHRRGRGDRGREHHRPARGDRGGCGGRTHCRIHAQATLSHAVLGRSCGDLSRGAHRPGRVRLRHHRQRFRSGAAARPGA